MKDDLIEHVAEFFDDLVAVAALDGVNQLVGLFEQVLGEAVVSLFGIPGATAGAAKFVGDGNQRVELWVGWVLCGFCRHGSSLPCGHCGQIRHGSNALT